MTMKYYYDVVVVVLAFDVVALLLLMSMKELNAEVLWIHTSPPTCIICIDNKDNQVILSNNKVIFLILSFLGWSYFRGPTFPLFLYFPLIWLNFGIFLYYVINFLIILYFSSISVLFLQKNWNCLILRKHFWTWTFSSIVVTIYWENRSWNGAI